MDAIAIKTADGLIQSGDRATASEFQRLACILSRNDCREVAETFTRLAARQRAAEFLTLTTGYQLPR